MEKEKCILLGIGKDLFFKFNFLQWEMMLRNSHWNKSKMIRLNDFILGRGKVPKKGRLLGIVAG